MSDAEREGIEEKIDGLSELISGLVREFAVFKTKLLGDDKDELPTGRIPMLEETQKRHGRRIARLEGFALMIFGAAMLIKAIGWIVETAHHFLEVVGH